MTDSCLLIWNSRQQWQIQRCINPH